jgi:hypothetical protein
MQELQFSKLQSDSDRAQDEHCSVFPSGGALCRGWFPITRRVTPPSGEAYTARLELGVEIVTLSRNNELASKVAQHAGALATSRYNEDHLSSNHIVSSGGFRYHCC